MLTYQQIIEKSPVPLKYYLISSIIILVCIKGSESVQKQKSLVVGYILAFFLGGIGAHLFYYRKYLRGFLYLLFCWTYVPIILGWIDLLFVKRWTNEINKSLESKKENESLLEKNDIEKLEIKQNIKTRASKTFERVTEVTNELFTSSKTENNFTFYNEEDIILPEYSHLKASNDILSHLKHRDEYYKDSNFKVTILTRESEFIEDSLKYSNEIGVKTKEIPFQSYWPTFRDLNERQLRWYLYWRGQVLKGNYLEVDISYIFIFVYELLNYSFNKNAAFNVSMLVRLLNNYKKMYPELERYLNVWIADMLYELGEQELAVKWDKPREYETSNLYQVLSKNKKDLGFISMNVWKPYIRNYRETVFFQKHKHKIYNKFKKSIPLIQKAYEEKGTDILNEWFNVIETRTIRHLYNAAVVDRVDRQIHIRVKRIETKETLYEVLTNLFRLAENVVRLEQGEKRQIKVDETVLPVNIKEDMFETKQRFKTVKSKEVHETGSAIPPPIDKSEEAIEEKKDSTTLNLDWEEIDKKEKELLKLQIKIEGLEENNEEPLGESVVDKDDKETSNTNEIFLSTNQQDTETIIEQSLDTIFQETDGDYDEFVDLLTNIEKQFLLMFKENVLSIEKAKTFAKKHGKMLGVFITEMNEKANECLGDILLEENEDSIELIEDYSDLIDILRGVEVEN